MTRNTNDTSAWIDQLRQKKIVSFPVKDHLLVITGPITSTAGSTIDMGSRSTTTDRNNDAWSKINNYYLFSVIDRSNRAQSIIVDLAQGIDRNAFSALPLDNDVREDILQYFTNSKEAFSQTRSDRTA